MNEKLFHHVKFHNTIHDTTASMHQQVPSTRKKMISKAHMAYLLL